MLLNHPCVLDRHKCTGIAGSLANDRGSSEGSTLQNKERCQDHSYSDTLPEQTTLWVQALGCQEKSSSWRYRDGEEAAALKELLEARLLPKEKGDVKKRDRHIKHSIFRRKRKASSASSCLQGFGVLQPRQGSHCGSCWEWDLLEMGPAGNGICWEWDLLHKQPGRSRGEGEGSREAGRIRKLCCVLLLCQKNEKKL